MDHRKKTGILFGGRSAEYGVSLQSASAVIRGMNRDKYEPVLIGIDRKGRWFLYEGETDWIEEDCWLDKGSCTPAAPCMDPSVHGILLAGGGGPERLSLDLAMPVLHGRNGEDGTVQGVLELMGVPVVGCDTLAGAVCMDKDMSHRLASAAGIRTPRSFRLTAGQAADREWVERLALELGYPLFVKPLRSGSSFGITRAAGPEELFPAVKDSLRHDNVCLLEEAIGGCEVGCAILGDNRRGREELFVGEVDEIELSRGFFDYTEKYSLKTSRIHVPARIGGEKAGQIREAAKTVYRALGCSYFARVDFFLTPEGEIYFNEVNTIPGFTAHSRYPGMMRAAGLEFEELLERLFDMAVEEGETERKNGPDGKGAEGPERGGSTGGAGSRERGGSTGIDGSRERDGSTGGAGSRERGGSTGGVGSRKRGGSGSGKGGLE